jgi:hypothetical protein
MKMNKSENGIPKATSYAVSDEEESQEHLAMTHPTLPPAKTQIFLKSSIIDPWF